jgi:hypothetical protein
MTTSAPDREKVSVVRDVLDGVIMGDFSKQLGPAGALAQMVLGFVPGVGTLAALRDLLADWAAGDALGVLLNFIALIPIFGGFAKTAEVLHHLRRLRHSLHGYGASGATTLAVGGAGTVPEARHGPSIFALFSLLMGILAPIISSALAIYGMTSLAPNLGWTSTPERLAVMIVAVFLAPVLGIVTGHMASHRARRRYGRHARRPLARVGLALGYIYLVGFGAALALLLSLTHLV